MEGVTRRTMLRWTAAGFGGCAAGCMGLNGTQLESIKTASTTTPSETTADVASTRTETQVSPTARLPEADGCPSGTTTESPSPENGPVISIEAETDQYYSGPLFLCHEHFYVPAPVQKLNWSMTSECLPWYLSFMKRNGISTVVTFNGSTIS